MSWSLRNQSKYIGGIVLVVVLVIVWIGYSVLQKDPTCFDGKHNGDESGIDCGGSCAESCTLQANDPIIHWARFFEVIPGVYNAVALIENPNVSTQALDVPYVFSIFDGRGLLVYERKGKVDITKDQFIPVFETNISTGDNDPLRTLFELTENPDWKDVGSEQVELRATDVRLSGENDSPRVSAIIENRSVEPVFGVDVTAIVFGSGGNAVGVSKTFLETVDGNSSKPVVFTWPQKFSSGVVTIDVIPIVRSN